MKWNVYFHYLELVLDEFEAKKVLNKVFFFVRSDDECLSTSDVSDPLASSHSECSFSSDDSDGGSDSDAVTFSSSGLGGIRSKDEENVVKSMEVDDSE